ncbi:hypothetical protein RRG08_038363 [Elysia crispata]|uniref:Uncharacterized protein n=1 Tax=Elysia crispata TaxID=231223 RepID=A0AAE0Z0Q8_9GAST|nr:hypothetical protein RRG08_038363 [Elysia crispata]
MEAIPSPRGGQELCLDRYTYVWMLQKRYWTRWQCVREKRALEGSCNYRIQIAQKLRERMKAAAREFSSKLCEVPAQELKNTSEERQGGLGQLESVKRDLRRQRRAVLLKESSMQIELLFEDERRTTSDENAVPFLLHDSE